ncbi:MAG: lytic murein transglycosylase [Candidatus Liptonbacteria bacterium]|nr:lytic murein transglycosylase [Candidatus Liptonbacteria bacterium]
MSLLHKPHIVQDVKKEQVNVFRAAQNRLNLSYRSKFRWPVSLILRTAVIAASVGFLMFGSAAAPTTYYSVAKATSAAEEREQLEAQLKELEQQINTYESQISSYRKQGTSLKGEIGRLNDKIAKLNLQIKAVGLSLRQLDQRIGDTQSQIVTTEASIATNRVAMAGLIRNMYQTDRANLLEIFLKNPRLSDFFTDVSQANILQRDIRVTIARITDLSSQLKEHRTQLALARADATTIQEYQRSQKGETDQLRAQKDQLLKLTKGQESRYQDLLVKTKATAAQIRNRIFELLGGGELTFGQAYNYAKVASAATGVREALILAVLDRESALGKNVGRCSYRKAMSPDNQKIFLNLIQKLIDSKMYVGDLETVTVSCANADGAYGGAMGPAQFIPSTWVSYEDRIAKVTGHTPPSPWNHADAFVATALYLQDSGAAGGSISDERIAAAKYYAGGNWRRFLWTYGEAVVSRARSFQDDIEEISL